MTSDDEDIPLNTICELISTLPELVKAQIMKYQRIAEQNRPTRRKINSEFRRIVTLQTIIVGDSGIWPLYPSFIKFMKKIFFTRFGPNSFKSNRDDRNAKKHYRLDVPI